MTSEPIIGSCGLPTQHQDPDKWAGDPEYYPKLVRDLEEKVRLLEVKADRWDKLWRLKRFVPSRDPRTALCSFMCWCSQQEGEAALDAIKEE